MKIKLLIAMLVFVISFSAEAQKKRGRKVLKMSTEQQATLTVKQMILTLDLSEKQQKEIMPLISQQIKEKKNAFRSKIKGQKLNSDELFEMKNKFLDAKIMMKNKMKQILDDQQFKKFLKMAAAKKRKGMKKKKRKF